MTEVKSLKRTALFMSIVPILCGGLAVSAWADGHECGDDLPFGECRVLIEINSTDGDIGFHWLADGDDFNSTRIDDPNGAKVFENGGFGPLRNQKLTESFGESSEPPCWDQEGEADEDEIITMRDFRDNWEPGTYRFSGKRDEGEKAYGSAELTYHLPAAPIDVDYDDGTGEISWTPGDDLGNCTPEAPDSLQMLVDDGVLAALPGDVPVLAWEVVMEPDVDDTDARAGLVFKTRVGAAANSVTVPADYLVSLGANTPVKVEVGAIGGDFEIDDGEVEGDHDNATFTEADGFCVNGDDCED